MESCLLGLTGEIRKKKKSRRKKSQEKAFGGEPNNYEGIRILRALRNGKSWEFRGGKEDRSGHRLYAGDEGDRGLV